MQALTALFRRACAADQSRVLLWIREGLQQQLQQLQHERMLQQRRAQQQELSALLHMLLILTDDINGECWLLLRVLPVCFSVAAAFAPVAVAALSSVHTLLGGCGVYRFA